MWEARISQMDDYLHHLHHKESAMSEHTVAEDAIVIERVFDVPITIIWQMWTQPDHFKQWYAPEGFSVPVAEMDVRVGGKHLFCMERATPEGSMRMWTTGEYIEVAPHERLVYTERMADEHGQPIQEMSDGSPTTTQVSVTLEDLGGRTKMVLIHAGLPVQQRGARQGWEQALAKMADHIAETHQGQE
jgi:uncharacterized protein YndB with AHSA1/START domain